MSDNLLTIEALQSEASRFAELESVYPEPSLYGVTDGKAVGTYLEHKFKTHLAISYLYSLGNSASGIDLPSLNVDIKVTSKKQPQSSSPFKSARQKIFGLGYSLLVFVYTKHDDHSVRSGTLKMDDVIFIEKERTADYQMTRGINQILDNDGNQEDLMAYMADRNLQMDDIEANSIADELMALKSIPIGYLTITNAFQWRLNYTRAISYSGTTDGINKIV